MVGYGVCDMHHIACCTPVIDRPIQVENAVEVMQVVGMNLFISDTVGRCPFVVHANSVKRSLPMHQVFGYVKITVCTNAADVVASVILHHARVGNTG